MIRFLLALTLLLGASPPQEEIRLVVRSDDLGAAQAVNEGCLKSFTDGIARTVEVIVPGPWYLDAVRLLKDRPDLDVGLHLCLTSEWENVKWGPLTASPSLADARGHFFPMTRQRQDFPPNTGFVDAAPKPEEVERELRAQIETIRKDLPRVSHLTAHMGTATATPELKAIVRKLSEEFKLPLEAPGLRPVKGFGGARKSAEQKEADLVAILENLGAGTWLIVEHPALDTPESRRLGHLGYENVAEDRAGVLHALTSERVKKVVKDRGIRLTSYREVLSR
jgi:predicted glycoside hydrolase/deacetylase ChbG (UPF0249 family)